MPSYYKNVFNQVLIKLESRKKQMFGLSNLYFNPARTTVTKLKVYSAIGLNINIGIVHKVYSMLQRNWGLRWAPFLTIAI